MRSSAFVIPLLLYQSGLVELQCWISNCVPAYCSYSGCDKCNEGYYLRYSQCKNCFRQCSECYSYSNCSKCESGYYGTQCRNTCTGCKNGDCLQDTGVCSRGCETGFYQIDNGKCSQCGNNCDICESFQKCLTCANHYYLQPSSSNLANCRVCPDSCTKCTDYETCSECKSNYWGSACQYECLNCKYSCDKNSGCSSQCKDRFYQRNNYIKGGMECLACPNSCTSCTSGTNCLSCSPGFNGSTCQHDCKHCNGQICNKDTGFCTFICASSQYFDRITPGCSNCPARCLSCASLSLCYACKAGFWGDICQKDCNQNCKDNICDKNYGVCTNGCKNGYFGNGYFGLTCLSQCLPGCESCSSGTQCDSCKINHFHKDNKSKCDCSMEQCSSKDGEICSKCLTEGWFTKANGCCQCSENCRQKDCFLNGTCVDCIDGSYGDNCERSCIYCKDSLCHRNGTCVSCPGSQFGAKCNQVCYYTIANCYRCNGQDVSSVICTRCGNGRYADGKTCKRCNDNCKYSACNGSTGTCTYGCEDGWFGNKCGSHCNVSNCYSCPSDPNVCTKCKDGYYKRTSLECIKCPANCKTGTWCDGVNGNCTDGCLHGWSGEQCDIRCPDICKTCDQTNNSLCNACNDNLYGYKCELNCGSNCRAALNEPTCNINNGACTNGCKDKYWGPFCDNDCGSGCNGTCDRSNGVCLSGCNFDYYGSLCNLKCSGNCAGEEDSVSNRTCNEVNGTCLYGCVDGFYGDTCKSVCSKQCNRTICDSRNGTCLFGCIDGYIGSRCNKAKSSAIVDPSGAVAVGVGTGIGVAILLIAATLIIAFILRKRRSSTKLDETNSSGNVVECSQAKSNEHGPLYRNIADIGSLEGDRYDSSNIVYANATVRMSDVSVDEGQTGQTYETLGNVDEDLFKEEKSIDKEPTLQKAIHVESLDDTYYNVDGKRVTVHNLQEYVRNKSHFELLEEFEKIPKGLLKDYKDAKKSDNAVKNKYRSIYPYDDSRVVLYDGGSDYMNASYITGCNKPKEYIASSGPFKKTYDTTPDFWRMVWQEKCENIVMLTNPVEGEERKCEVYWPEPGASKHFGDLHVTCLTEDRYSDFTIRTLTASQNSESLNIRHLHFTAWPDKGVPHDVTSMIEFGQKVRSLHKNKDCPMLVHCSAGIGRTGTFIALDMLTCEGESRGSVDIFSCVACLRSQRCNMVQTVDQYEYLHHAVLHSLTFDCRSIAAVDFQQHYARLIKEKSGVRPIDGQFQQLQAIVDEIQDDVRDEINRNKALRDKNRDAADIPEDSYRVKLHASRKPGASDYINAVFINGLRARQKFIVAQTPLPTTIVDFLTLIHQTKCSCVVMMEEADIKNKTMGVYWPADNQTSKHGIFKVSRKEAKSTRFYTRKTLSVAYHGPEGEEEHEVHLFIFTNWPRDSLVPKSPNSLLQFVKDVDTINRRGGNSPILIHCMTGSERSCLYCAVSNLVEKMEIEQEVSVVNTLRQIKARRLLAFPTIEQYMFCHEALISYLQTFETYSNFALQDSEA